MGSSTQYLKPSEAADRLGISIKALRLYEQHGLVVPIRTAAGWRAFSPEEMRRAAEIVALRTLGFSLAQVASVLAGNSRTLELALAAHQVALERQGRQIADTVETVRRLRDDLSHGQHASSRDLVRTLARATEPVVSFDLPWPWGGERFELMEIRPLNYIVGPLFSGKTRLAQCLTESLPGALFLGLDRLADDGAVSLARMEANPILKSRVDQTLAWIVGDGGTVTPALTALIVGLETDGHAYLVIDMIEQGLDHATQEALIAYLRSRGRAGRPPLFFLTRSSAILDLSDVGADEAIIFCPANHSPPTTVVPHFGSPGYEAVATCLAVPEVRARTEGVVAWRPQVAWRE